MEWNHFEQKEKRLDNTLDKVPSHFDNVRIWYEMWRKIFSYFDESFPVLIACGINQSLGLK